MSTELFLITDRSEERLLLSNQVAFGGKVICAAFWQICIPAAEGRSDGGNALWARWYEDFSRSMGDELGSFLSTVSKSAIRGGVPTVTGGVPIELLYSEVTRMYQVLTSFEFRRNHPSEALDLVPDVMALLNILESEIIAGAKTVAMGAE